MAEKITMPRLSDTMEEGTLVKRHKNVSDKVEEGDVIAEIETDKAIQEFESEFDGVLLYQGLKEGETAKVDTVLAVIGEEGESFDVERSEEHTSELQSRGHLVCRLLLEKKKTKKKNKKGYLVNKKLN